MTENPPFRPFERSEQARFASTRSLYAYWRRLHAELRRPARTDLDPGEMKSFLPNLLTGHIEAQPFRVLFRLVGTGVAEYSRFDFSHRYLDELATSDRDDVDWHACYRFVHAGRLPIVGDSGLRHKGGGILKIYEFAILPLWRDDDPAGGFVAIEAYDDVGPMLISDLNKVELKR